MLSLLFNKSFFTGIATMLVIIAIIYCCLKFPQARVYVFTLLGMLLVGSTFYSIYQINAYYSASGGIYGKLTTLLKSNQATTTQSADGTTIQLNGIVLTEADGVYSATITKSDTLSFDKNKTYTILVNGDPTTSTYNYGTTTTIRADYHYIFEDDNFSTLLDDNLIINFASYSNGYSVKLSTNGGADAVKYWSKYFSKNNCTLTIKEWGYKKTEITSAPKNIQDYLEENKLTLLKTINTTAEDSSINYAETDTRENLKALFDRLNQNETPNVCLLAVCDGKIEKISLTNYESSDSTYKITTTNGLNVVTSTTTNYLKKFNFDQLNILIVYNPQFESSFESIIAGTSSLTVDCNYWSVSGSTTLPNGSTTLYLVEC